MTKTPAMIAGRNLMRMFVVRNKYEIGTCTGHHWRTDKFFPSLIFHKVGYFGG